MVAHRGRLLVETDGELLGSCETSLIVTEEDVVVIPREPIEDVDTSDLVIESVTSGSTRPSSRGTSSRRRGPGWS